MILAQTSHAPLTIIIAYFKGHPSPAKHVDRPNIDVNDAGVNVNIGKHRDTPEVSTDREGPSATSTLALAHV